MYYKGKKICPTCKNYGKYLTNVGGSNIIVFCTCEYGWKRKKVYDNCLKKDHDHNCNRHRDNGTEQSEA